MSKLSPQEREKLFSILVAEYDYPFSGWDFSHLHGRMVEDGSSLTWSYKTTVASYVEKVQSLLDMGTGGGEYLASLYPLPAYTCATEGYEPNFAIARSRLEPLGVTVSAVSDDQTLPFQNCQFDLVINRHESYASQEVLRVLKSRGHFVTQQVGGSNNLDLNALLNANEDFGETYWNVDYAVKELEAVGMRILEHQEAFPLTRFFDVGAIVYYLKAIPWQIPDFSIEKYFEKLVEAEHIIQTNGCIKVRSHRFSVIAQKP